MAARMAYPCRRSLTIRPNVYVRDTGISSSRKFSSRLDSALGFSNGWLEFAL